MKNTVENIHYWLMAMVLMGFISLNLFIIIMKGAYQSWKQSK